MSSGLQEAEGVPKGETVLEGLGQGSKLSVGGGGGRPSGPFPE